MRCQICGENEANIHFKQVFDGAVKEMYVCSNCAERNGVDLTSPAAMADFLMEVDVHREKGAASDRSCPACDLSESEFQKHSRLGCPRCYEAFAEEIGALLPAMHRGTRHKGKIPARERVSVEMAAMQRALEKAVAGQDFEEAAKLRDRIRALKAGPLAGAGRQGGRSAD